MNTKNVNDDNGFSIIIDSDNNKLPGLATSRAWNASIRDNSASATSSSVNSFQSNGMQSNVKHKTIENVLNISFWNVHGLSSHFLDDCVCGKFLKTNDLILLCETPPSLYPAKVLT